MKLLTIILLFVCSVGYGQTNLPILKGDSMKIICCQEWTYDSIGYVYRQYDTIPVWLICIDTGRYSVQYVFRRQGWQIKEKATSVFNSPPTPPVLLIWDKKEKYMHIPKSRYCKIF